MLLISISRYEISRSKTPTPLFDKELFLTPQMLVPNSKNSLYLATVCFCLFSLDLF